MAKEVCVLVPAVSMRSTRYTIPVPLFKGAPSREVTTQSLTHCIQYYQHKAMTYGSSRCAEAKKQMLDPKREDLQKNYVRSNHASKHDV